MAQETWKRYFAPAASLIAKPYTGSDQPRTNFANSSKYASPLPQVYAGAPNRIDRYNQYEAMDLDSQISSSLDIIAEFCTQTSEETGMPFEFYFKNIPSASEAKILADFLKKWIAINKFNSRLFDIVRNIIKYGDQFFIRDPETQQWLTVYHSNVEKVIVNESEGKKPEQYSILDLDLNLQALAATQVPLQSGGTSPAIPGQTYNNIAQNTRLSSFGRPSRFSETRGATAVNAEHIVHLSMNNGLDPAWPFGTSILERIYKTYKQKELLEDSVLIYRIQRAPDRRVFYIDVGDLPEQKAMAFVEQVKNSINQKRIPSKTGGGTSIMDAAYNPTSILDDLYFPQNTEGKGCRVETLPGGDPTWGINELQYFDNKLTRGLRVPSSYLPTGADDSPATYSDGKVGNALIQEFRFSKFCERIQNTISRVFDEEFKLFLKRRDINISSDIFEVRFVQPQSFATWRQIELNSAEINNFIQIIGAGSFISKRYAMEKYLGWNKDEIEANIKMLIEENPTKFSKLSNISSTINSSDAPLDLRNVGINQTDLFDPAETETTPGAEEVDTQTPETEAPTDTSTEAPATPTTPTTPAP